MEELQYFERIEAYMDGKMTSIDRQQFETELKNNEILKDEYNAFLATTVALEWMATEDLSEKQNKKIPNKLTFIKNKKRWIAFAASVLFLLFIGIGSFANLNYSNNALVQEFYTSPNWTNIIRGNSSNTSQTEINQLLGSKNYTKVISLLEKLPEKNTSHYYLLANAYLKNEQIDRAIVTFQKVISSTDNDLKSSAEWYLALSYLQNNENKKAKNQIEFIIQDSNNPNVKKARDLKERLNNNWRIWVLN